MSKKRLVSYNVLFDAIDCVIAVDHGEWDSAQGEPWKRENVINFLKGLTPEQARVKIARVAREYLSDEAIDSEYGLKDVVALAKWLDSIGVEY